MNSGILKLFLAPQYRIVTILSLFVGIFSTIAIAMFCYSTYVNEFEDTEKALNNSSELMEHETISLFRHLDNTLLDLKERVESGQGYEHFSKEELTRLARTKAGKSLEIFDVIFFDAFGKYRGNTSGELPDYNVSDREYFQQHKSNSSLGLFISKPIISKTQGIRILTLTRRLENADGDFAGVVFISIPTSELSKAYSRISINRKGSHISLYTLEDRTLLARFPEAENYLGKSFVKTPMHQYISTAGLSDGVFSDISNVDAEQKIFSFRIMHGLGLIMIAGVSRDVVLRSAYDKVILAILIYALISSFAIFMLYRYINGQQALENQKIQLVQNSKMSALGEMAGGIAHEINNPLSIIKGRAEQLSRILQRPDFDKEKALSIVEGIEKTALRIANIVKGLRSFSRSGEADPLATAMLGDIVNASLELCQEKFKNSNVELRTAEVPSIPLSCRETQISQVVLNLLGNAFDAVVSTANPWVEISYKEYNQNVEILITDSGHGISPAIEAKIMQPFFTTKAVGKGTGLGLSISKGIIEDHQGKLFLNRSCENTQFVISLPKSQIKIDSGKIAA